MYMFGGMKDGDYDACCGYSSCGGVEENGCPFLRDVWRANIASYEPFETQLALEKHAVQSSTYTTGYAGAAVDGNRSGIFSSNEFNSVTQTLTEPQAWWQVNLGARNYISNLTIFNRIDGYKERLSNFYVLISTTPFSSNRLQDLLHDPVVWKFHMMYVVEDETTITVQRYGWFVRIQLAGTGILSLAEVEVWGYPPIEPHQHFMETKRWTRINHEETSDYPKGRMGASLLRIGDELVLYGGFVKDSPFFLSEWWSVQLEPYANHIDGGRLSQSTKLSWKRIEPESKRPEKKVFKGRYGHTVLVSQHQPLPGVGTDADLQAIFIVYGGRGSAKDEQAQGFLNEILLYNKTSNVLSEIHPSGGSGPAGRVGHSMVLYNPKVCRGTHREALSSVACQFDADCECFGVQGCVKPGGPCVQTSTTRLYVFGGQSDYGVSNGPYCQLNT